MTTCSVPKEDLWELIESNAMEAADAALRHHVENCDVCQSRIEEHRGFHAQLESVGQLALPRCPERIGPYRIIRRVGAGGMGVVYEAEQEEPRRRVALKVMSTATGAVPRRLRGFHREIQILGRLRHASIARIYDAGRTDEGHPYFVMELIDGQSLVRYGEHRKLSIRERAALFVRVCEAVHYAHQRGVIHRDLKPANILVDSQGIPHVLDFGLARLTDSEFDATCSVSAGIAPIGTLGYMSPEQTARDTDDLDLRTDVYSLGVMLYEMMTAQHPFDLTGPVGEVLHKMASCEPVRPAEIRPEIGDELETIILTAMARERDRRYASVAALADDLDRYRIGEAITARPPSLGYHLRVFARRNRAVVGTAAAAVVALCCGVIGTTTSYLNAEAARAETADQRDQADEVNDFLMGMLLSVDPEIARKEDVTLRSVLDKAGQKIEAEGFSRDPEVEARVRLLMARIYLQLAHADDAAHAVTHARAALKIRRRLYTNEHVLIAEALNDLGMALRTVVPAGEEGRALLRQAWAMRQRLLGETHPDTLTSMHNLAILLTDAVDAEAGVVLRNVLALQRKVLGDQHPDVARTLLELAMWVSWCVEPGDCAEKQAAAETFNRDALKILLAYHGDQHRDVARARRALGSSLRYKRDYAGAEPELRQALDVQRNVLRKGHPSIGGAAGSLGMLLLKMGKLGEAEDLLREALEIALAFYGDQSRRTAGARSGLGECLTRLGRHEEAREELLEAYDVQARAFDGGAINQQARKTADRLSLLYEALGRADPAAGWSKDVETFLREAVARHRTTDGDAHEGTGARLTALGECLTRLGRYAGAEAQLLEAHRVLLQAVGDEHKWTTQARKALVALYEAWQKPAQADKWRARLTADSP